MKASIDPTVCLGYANCVIEADRVFDIDESTEQAVVLLSVIPRDLEEATRRAAASCPVSAIRPERTTKGLAARVDRGYQLTQAWAKASPAPAPPCSNNATDAAMARIRDRGRRPQELVGLFGELSQEPSV